MPSLRITVSCVDIANIEKIKWDATAAVENVLAEHDIEEDEDNQVDWEVVEI